MLVTITTLCSHKASTKFIMDLRFKLPVLEYVMLIQNPGWRANLKSSYKRELLKIGSESSREDKIEG